MFKYCKYIVILFFATLFSVNLTQDSSIVTAPSISGQLSNNTFCNTQLCSTSTDGKLPKPVQPIQKKQATKRLIGKRVLVSAIHLAQNTASSYNNGFYSQLYVVAQSYHISFYKQAIMYYCSLQYLF